MSMKKLIVFLIFSCFSGLTQAECGGHACSQVRIVRLAVSSYGDVKINTTGDESSLSCNADSYGYLSLKKQAENFEELYSLLLALKMTDTVIDRIRTTDSGPCEIAYVIHD